jgi:prepilin signal peptidase PulO-like enzyme (type II secretory pathway)
MIETQWMVVIAMVGAVMGSFLTLLSYRLPRGENVVHVPSRCATCGAQLKVRDLVPIFSWVAYGGKARCCGARISVRYPLIELAAALSAVAVAHGYGISWQAACLALFCWCSIGMIVTDLEHYFLPDMLQIALAIAAIAYGVATVQPMLAVAISGAVGLLIGLTLRYGCVWILGKEGLGLGDVKFLGVAGLWLASAPAFVPYLFLSGVLGVVFGLGWRAATGSRYFPFGPALISALAVAVFLPETMREFWRLYGFLS